MHPAQSNGAPQEMTSQGGEPKDDLFGMIKMIMENSDRFYKHSNEVQERNDKRFEVLEYAAKRIENMVGELVGRS